MPGSYLCAQELRVRAEMTKDLRAQLQAKEQVFSLDTMNVNNRYKFKCLTYLAGCSRYSIVAGTVAVREFNMGSHSC